MSDTPQQEPRRRLSTHEELRRRMPQKTYQIQVLWQDGFTTQYASVRLAQTAILDAYAESGTNPVDTVWAVPWEQPEANEVLLGCEWSVQLVLLPGQPEEGADDG